MDEQGVIKRFQKVKVLTIEQLASLLEASIVTARRKLKKWDVFTSINMNGRYYTLPKIPDFDKNGLWKYQSILFSKHGNLMQTITALVEASQVGLSARQIARVLDIPANSSIFSRLPAVPGIQRERHQGRFVYFSEEHYQDQKAAFSLVQSLSFPSEADAVRILVEFIKQPNTDIHELARFLSKKGIKTHPDAIYNFFEYHGLQKKLWIQTDSIAQGIHG